TLKGHTHSGSVLAFTPDGKLLITGDTAGVIKIWKADNGRPVRSFEAHGQSIDALTISPDSQRLATASLDTTARVWNIASGEMVCMFVKHAKPVQSVAFSSDGLRLAAGCAETAQLWSPSRPSGTIRIWETAPPDPDQLLQREAMNLVDQLFDYYIDRVDVVAYLRRTASFGAGVRQAALAAAEQHRGNPLWLNNLSWRTVSKPDMPPDAYRKALRQAEEAVQLE